MRVVYNTPEYSTSHDGRHDRTQSAQPAASGFSDRSRLRPASSPTRLDIRGTDVDLPEEISTNENLEFSHAFRTNTSPSKMTMEQSVQRCVRFEARWRPEEITARRPGICDFQEAAIKTFSPLEVDGVQQRDSQSRF
jgi:hypothetical protein